MSEPSLTPPADYTPVMAEIAQVLFQRLEGALPVEMASALALHLTDDLMGHFGGVSVYFPSKNRARRNAAILRDFNGANARALARRYGMSLSAVYEVLAAERTARAQR